MPALLVPTLACHELLALVGGHESDESVLTAFGTDLGVSVQLTAAHHILLEGETAARAVSTLQVGVLAGHRPPTPEQPAYHPQPLHHL